MRIDRHFFNMVKIISYEKELGNDANKYLYILELYQKNSSIGETLHKICDGTNISNEDKQYFFVKQDWNKEISDIHECSYIQLKTKERIEKAYKNISLFVKKAKTENNRYMNSPNNFTKQGRKDLRQVAFDFNKSTSAICREIENICSYYSEKEIKNELLNFPLLRTAPQAQLRKANNC